MAQKDRFYSPQRPSIPSRSVGKRVSLFVCLPYVLSRACLGKMIIFSTKWQCKEILCVFAYLWRFKVGHHTHDKRGEHPDEGGAEGAQRGGAAAAVVAAARGGFSFRSLGFGRPAILRIAAWQRAASSVTPI